MPFLIFANICYSGHNLSWKQARNFWFSPFIMIFNSLCDYQNFKILDQVRIELGTLPTGGDRTLGRSGHRGVVFTRSDRLSSEFILN